MTIITAGAECLNCLYHYQPFDIDRLRPIVCNNLIYLSNPAQFNDPWDCKPCYNADLSDPGALKRHVDWYISVTRRHRRDIPEIEVRCRADELSRNPELFRSKIMETSAAIVAAVAKKNRLYCLSTRPDCELMWAHYANKHRGVCLEFLVQNRVMCTALKVSYATNYPILDLTADADEDHLLPLLCKSAVWNYEDEYRLIAQEQLHATPHDTLTTRDSLLEIPEGSLNAIIVGCLVPDTTSSSILRLIKHAGRSIQLKRATRAPDQYKLVIT